MLQNETFKIIFIHSARGQSREIGKYKVHESIWIFGKDTKLPETVISKSKKLIKKHRLIKKLIFFQKKKF